MAKTKKKAPKKTAHHRAADALHKGWLRAQIKIARKHARAKHASDADHRKAITRLKSLAAELHRLS